MIENPRVVPLLQSLSSSETALLEWLEPHIDASHLEEIAAADYGFEAKEHLQALKRIYARQPIPVPLEWVPREVLELMRWSEPEHPKWKPGSTGTRGHLIRAFCCAILLQAAAPETAEYIQSENNTLIQLLASVLHLGRDASASALRFLCWRAARLPDDDEELPFFALAVLLLYAHLFKPDLFKLDKGEANLRLLAEWVVNEEARVRERGTARSQDWLLGLTYFDQRHTVWKRVAQEVLVNPAMSFPEPAATALRHIVQRLVPER